jgi:predicted  nucleic acid-binding Zn-ribbon protein
MQQDKAESDTLGASLDELLATRTAEAQFLRSQAELERYKARLKAADLEKQVALKDSELERFRAALRESLAEHLRTKRDLLALERQYETKSDDFQMELQQLQSECTELRRALASSWALRIARSLGWLLGPVRKRMA